MDRLSLDSMMKSMLENCCARCLALSLAVQSTHPCVDFAAATMKLFHISTRLSSECHQILLLQLQEREQQQLIEAWILISFHSARLEGEEWKCVNTVFRYLESNPFISLSLSTRLERLRHNFFLCNSRLSFVIQLFSCERERDVRQSWRKNEKKKERKGEQNTKTEFCNIFRNSSVAQSTEKKSLRSSLISNSNFSCCLLVSMHRTAALKSRLHDRSELHKFPMLSGSPKKSWNSNDDHARANEKGGKKRVKIDLEIAAYIFFPSECFIFFFGWVLYSAIFLLHLSPLHTHSPGPSNEVFFLLLLASSVYIISSLEQQAAISRHIKKSPRE